MQRILRRLVVAVVVCGLMVPASVRVQAQAGEPAVAAKSGERTTPEANVEKKEVEKDEAAEYRHSPTVVKLGGMLGLSPDAAATAFTLLNLAVLVAGVGFLLARSLPKAFRKRNTEIQKHLVDARTATEEASARLSGVEARLAKLDEQIAAMKTQAEADAARDERRIKAGIEDEKSRIVAAAEQEIASAATAAQKQIQKYAAELAVEHAARKLVITAETDRLLVEGFAHKLGGTNGGQN